VTANNGVAFILQGVPKTKNGDPMGEARWTLGQLDAHEFFHAMQRAHSTPAGTQIKEWPPSWIIEGGASLVQNLAMSHASYDEYMKWRKLDARSISGSYSVVNQAFVDRFLDVQGNKDYWRGVDNYYSYNLGSRIMEILVAYKGPAILLDLHKQTTVLAFKIGVSKFNLTSPYPTGPHTWHRYLGSFGVIQQPPTSYFSKSKLSGL
jgi:hypothetical protein